LLEEEITALLGRSKSARRTGLDASKGLRNGYGKPRRFTLTAGTITLRRPRVRGLDERFVSRVLPLFKRWTREVGELLPQLYLHGLALGDFNLALRGLLGDAAPLSPASLTRLKAQWQLEYEAWKRRRLDDLEVAYVWADGLYVKAGLEDSKAALADSVRPGQEIRRGKPLRRQMRLEDALRSVLSEDIGPRHVTLHEAIVAAPWTRFVLVRHEAAGLRRSPRTGAVAASPAEDSRGGRAGGRGASCAPSGRVRGATGQIPAQSEYLTRWSATA